MTTFYNTLSKERGRSYHELEANYSCYSVCYNIWELYLFENSYSCGNHYNFYLI